MCVYVDGEREGGDRVIWKQEGRGGNTVRDQNRVKKRDDCSIYMNFILEILSQTQI